ncbi:DUF1177 domain-containing protein [Petroclostridium sp. X23]|uniref:DUF1177 domain-containing protein n=1 Tax=Petroclostridium sp. X23 TaxID=3045146 RepID=UPI0024ACAE01|nr:DUF1177 domain-containing protein [Petroclostridium sp. X23]WHH60486.1 DUF1177 domain-containing protein [Petroclostridium sp. X23]
MCLRQTMEIYEVLDSKFVDGETIVKMFKDRGIQDASTKRLYAEGGYTDLVSITIKGKNGKSSGGTAPTLNIAGSLGGVGGRPAVTGIVSDADGALVAIASGLKLADMQKNGDYTDGDIVVRTTICPNAPTMPHDPVPFMSSYVDFVELKKNIIDETADAALVTETTKGNKVLNNNGFAITPTVKAGWVLKVSNDAIDVMERVTGKRAIVIPITMQDITPVCDDIHHLNGLCEIPAGVAMPVLGVAITTEIPVSGAASGASSIIDMEAAVRYCVEIAKDFGKGKFNFYDKEEFNKLVAFYGSMEHLQTKGNRS